MPIVDCEQYTHHPQNQQQPSHERQAKMAIMMRRNKTKYRMYRKMKSVACGEFIYTTSFLCRVMKTIGFGFTVFVNLTHKAKNCPGDHNYSIKTSCR